MATWKGPGGTLESDQYYRDEDAARILGLTVRTLRARLGNGHRLPRCLVLTGQQVHDALLAGQLGRPGALEAEQTDDGGRTLRGVPAVPFEVRERMRREA